MNLMALFAGTIIVGSAASAVAFYSKKYAIDENKEFLKFYAFAILLMSVGFSLHTSGDYFAELYGIESIEKTLESAAHVVLFASFLLFVNSSSKILKSARKFWFS